jgi:anti-sigma-K factor RskA
MTADDFLDELSSALRGPRRRRQRLISELAAHIDDAIRAEVAANAPPEQAERDVLDRLGSAAAIARRWNDDRRGHRETWRRRAAVIALTAVAAGALGVTQYAAGKPQPPKPDAGLVPPPRPAAPMSEPSGWKKQE